MSDSEKKKINDSLIAHIKEQWKDGKITGSLQDPPVFVYYGVKDGKPHIMQANFFMVKLSYPNVAPSLFTSLAADQHFGCIDTTMLDEKRMPRVVIIRKERCR